MQVILSNRAKKQLGRLNEPYKSQIRDSINNLEKEPPEGNIKKLQGRVGYRVTIGNYRVLFEIDKKNNLVKVFKIASRGDVYKEQ